MSVIQAIILGIIQGLTEFLPVSSSGHIELGEALFGLQGMGDESITFTVLVHAATALSTVVVFREDVAQIFKGLFKFKRNEETEFSIKIIISMIPAAFIGLMFDDYIKILFDNQVLLVGAMLGVTGLLLFLADRAKKTHKGVGYTDALIIGLAQAIAILPGISRSGATVSTSVLLGIDRARAARFSFLMVVPLILGKMAKDILDGGFSIESDMGLAYMSGFAAAFVSGWLACKWMIALVKRANLRYFAYYCFAVGASVILYFAFWI